MSESFEEDASLSGIFCRGSRVLSELRRLVVLDFSGRNGLDSRIFRSAVVAVSLEALLPVTASATPSEGFRVWDY